MVRENVDTSLPRVVVVLDDRAEAHGPDATGESTFESACEAAASVIVAAVREYVHIELQLVSGAAAAGTHTDVGPLLDLLAEAELRPGELLPAVERLRVRRMGDTLLYLTGPPNQDDLGAVTMPSPAPPVTPRRNLSSRRNFTRVLGNTISTSLRGMFLNSLR